MATVGRRNPRWRSCPGAPSRGRRVGWTWLGLHLDHADLGFRNRANVMVNWAWNYVTYDRRVGSDVVERRRPPGPAVGSPDTTDPDR